MANKVSAEAKNYLISVAAILLVVFLVPAVILPQIKKINENLKVVNEEGKRLDSLKAKADALDQLASNIDELDKNLRIAESALPIEKDVARLVRGVQNLAITGGLEVSKVEVKPGKTATESATPATAKTSTTNTSATKTTPTPTTPVTPTVRSEFIFEINMRGNLVSFENFLKSIEGTKRLLILSAFKSNSSGGSDFTFNVTINAPFSPLPKPAADQLAKAVASLSDENKKLLEALGGNTFKNVTNYPLPTGPTGVSDPFK